MNPALGEQISALRKARGLTQEQLGQLVGVSAQAVSKWENGGAPDVELLPVLARRLGVTIDGLFGLEGEPQEDISQHLARWLNSLPVEERFSAMFRLLASAFPNLCQLGGHNPDVLHISASSSCYLQGLSAPAWLRALMNTREGLLLSVLSEDFPLFLLLPQPPEGYARHFAPDRDYRLLFSALAQEGSLEILRYLYGQKNSYYTASSLAKRTRLSPQLAQNALSAMERCHLVQRRALELDDASVDAYALHDNYAFVPFLYLSRWLMEENDAWSCCWDSRDCPILSNPAEEKEAELGRE